MTRTRVTVCAAAGLALAGLTAGLPDVQAWAGTLSSAILGRAAGVALLGLAMIATGLVFRWAMAPAPVSSTPVHPATSEFRRGFASRGEPRFDRVPARPAVPRGVIALRQAVLTQAATARLRAMSATPPQTDIKRLQDLLQSRVVQLVPRAGEPAPRRFRQDFVERHDLPRS